MTASVLKELCHIDDSKVFTPRKSKGKTNGVKITKFSVEQGIKALCAFISLEKCSN